MALEDTPVVNIYNDKGLSQPPYDRKDCYDHLIIVRLLRPDLLVTIL